MLGPANQLGNLGIAVDQDIAQGGESLEEVRVEGQRRGEEVLVVLGGEQGLGALGGQHGRGGGGRDGGGAGEDGRGGRGEREEVGRGAQPSCQRGQRVCGAARASPFAAAAPHAGRAFEHLRYASSAQASAARPIRRVHALVLLEFGEEGV